MIRHCAFVLFKRFLFGGTVFSHEDFANDQGTVTYTMLSAGINEWCPYKETSLIDYATCWSCALRQVDARR